MAQPSLPPLRDLVVPPDDGGDQVDWDGVREGSGVVLPADYRALVEVYGGGEFDEFFGLRTPPVPHSPYADLLDGMCPALDAEGRDKLPGYFPAGVGAAYLVFGSTAAGDASMWLRTGGNPDSWPVATFMRQAGPGEPRWSVFEGGVAEFLLAVLEDRCRPFSSRVINRPPHVFESWRKYYRPGQ